MNQFFQTWKGTRLENQFHRVATIGLIVAVIVLALQNAQKDTAVILVPPNLDKEVQVARTQADRGYRESWGLYLATLLGNITPNNLAFVRERIGSLLDPSIFTDVTQSMDTEINRLKQEQVTQRFEPKIVLSEDNKVFVTGKIYAAGPGGTEQPSDRTYEFEIDLTNYRPRLTYIATYSTGPRTKAAMDKEMQREERAEAKRKKAEGK